MRKSITLVLFFVICSLSGEAFADIPPDPGFKRVTLNLIVEPKEEFSDYRFFVKTGPEVSEVILKKGEPKTIKSQGGGAFYRAGVLLAVPKSALASLSESANGEKLNDLQKAIYDGKIAGTIELVKHSFIRDVPIKEAASLRDPVYHLERDADKSIRAVVASGGAGGSNANSGGPIFYSREEKTPLFWASVIGGSLLTLGFVFFGVWFLRRSKTKSVEFGPSR
jgi:hypothetical protein